MSSIAKKKETHKKRKLRIRKKVSGTPERPRLSVFRSAKHISAQIIDDTKGTTLTTASTYEKTFKEKLPFDSKADAAKYIGKLLAGRAKELGIDKVVFDRNGFLYHGRVKAVSDGAREAGLNL